MALLFRVGKSERASTPCTWMLRPPRTAIVSGAMPRAVGETGLTFYLRLVLAARHSWAALKLAESSPRPFFYAFFTYDRPAIHGLMTLGADTASRRDPIGDDPIQWTFLNGDYDHAEHHPQVCSLHPIR